MSSFTLRYPKNSLSLAVASSLNPKEGLGAGHQRLSLWVHHKNQFLFYHFITISIYDFASSCSNYSLANESQLSDTRTDTAMFCPEYTAKRTHDGCVGKDKSARHVSSVKGGRRKLIFPASSSKGKIHLSPH